MSMACSLASASSVELAVTTSYPFWRKMAERRTRFSSRSSSSKTRIGATSTACGPAARGGPGLEVSSVIVQLEAPQGALGNALRFTEQQVLDKCARNAGATVRAFRHPCRYGGQQSDFGPLLQALEV